MTETPQDPTQPPAYPPAYPAAPPPGPLPGTQGGWGDASVVRVPDGYGSPTPYAEWIKRVGGYLVDAAVLIPAYLVALIGAGLASTDNSAVSAIGLVIAIVGYVGAIGIAIWNMIVRQGRTGWSIGKQLIGIRLIGEKTGRPIGPGLTFVRMLCHVLDSLPCNLGYLWPLWDPKRQTFADKIMSTVVIVQKKA